MKKILGLAALVLTMGCASTPTVGKLYNKPVYTLNLENGGGVFLDKKPLNNILQVYDRQNREIPLCLYGRQMGENFYITDTSIPVIGQSTDDFATWDLATCTDRRDFIGMVHNHPTGYCGHSRTDYISLLRHEKIRVSIVACDINSETRTGHMEALAKRNETPGILPSER